MTSAGQANALERPPEPALKHLPTLACLLPLVAGAAASGCASYGSVRFQPNPLSVALDGEEGAARALVSVRGIQDEGDDRWSVGVLLRLDNRGSETLTLVEEECELVDGSLEPLGRPRVARREAAGVDPGAALAVAPGASGLFELTFPFRPDHGPAEADLSGLHLSWAVDDGARRLHASATFERALRDAPDAYGWSYYGYRSYYDCHPWLGFHSHAYGPYW